MLSDRSIRSLLGKGDLRISPELLDHQFQPASVDLRLYNQFIRIEADGEVEFDNAEIWIEPGECVLASTHEYITLPRMMVARVEGKSTWGRQFLQVHSTAGFIDPGFAGRITLELKNQGPRTLVLSAGTMICQISFDWLSYPADRPYGHPELRSRYTKQFGPTIAMP